VIEQIEPIPNVKNVTRMNRVAALINLPHVITVNHHQSSTISVPITNA